MAKLNYNEIESALYNMEEFVGNSCHAKLMESNSQLGQGVAPQEDFEKMNSVFKANSSCYVVFSYNTPIAIQGMDTGEVVIPEVKYSSTTSRQQNLCRKYLR